MNRRSLLVGLLCDIGLPVAVYYGCRTIGVESHLALLVGGCVGLVRVAGAAVRRRRLNGLAALVAGTFLVLLAVSSWTGDERILLSRDSIVSAALGLLLLGSCLVGRPLMYSLVRRLHADDRRKLAEWDGFWRTRPEFRRIFMVMSVVWGTVLLVESVVRIVLIYLLPVDVMAGLSTLIQLCTVALLFVWTLWYRKGRERGAASAAVPARRRR
jgi:hypothetical protein